MFSFPIQKLLLYIPAFAADAVAVNSDGIKMLLADGLSTFLMKEKPVFSVF